MKFIYAIIAVVGTIVSMHAQIFKGNTNNGEHFKHNQIISIGANSDRFGYKLDENDGLLISGNPYSTVNGNLEDGKANIYEFDTLSKEWEFKQQLIPWGYIDSGGEFGAAVGMNNDYAFVGALRGNDTLDPQIYGIVYVFKNENGTFVPHQRILGNIDNNTRLGRKLEVSDSTVALISADSMNIYGLNEQSGFWEKEYGTSDITISVEVDDDQFFGAIGDSLVVFEKQNSEWVRKQSILIKSSETTSTFYSVKYSNNHLAVARAINHDLLGSIFIYEKDDQNTWSLFTEIGDQNIYYGLKIDLDEDYLVYITEPYEQQMLSGYSLYTNGLVVYKRGVNTYNYHQHIVLEDENWHTMYRLVLTKGALVYSNRRNSDSDLYSFAKLDVDDWEYKSIKCSTINFGGEQITTEGSYFDTLISNQDTSVSALFVIDPPTAVYSSTVISEVPYEYNGVTYNESKTLLDTFTNVLGCDSVIELKLFIVGSERLSSCLTAEEFKVGFYQVTSEEEGWGKFIANSAGRLTISSCGLTEENTHLTFNTDCSTEITEPDECGETGSELTYDMIVGDSILFEWLDSYDRGEFIYEIRFESEVVTNINTFEKLSAQKAYPNPTDGILKLEGFDKDKRILVVNSLGEKVISINTTPNSLDFSKIPSGVYLIIQEKAVLQVIKE